MSLLLLQGKNQDAVGMDLVGQLVIGKSAAYSNLIRALFRELNSLTHGKLD